VQEIIVYKNPAQVAFYQNADSFFIWAIVSILLVVVFFKALELIAPRRADRFDGIITISVFVLSMIGGIFGVAGYHKFVIPMITKFIIWLF